MGGKAPRGPSPEEIARQAREQERKVKFEDAKGRYLGRVASRELAAATGRQRGESSLEYEEMQTAGFVPEASLFIPERFAPETSVQMKGASADYSIVEVPFFPNKDRINWSGGPAPDARSLEKQGYKFMGASKDGTKAIYQRGTASVIPEEQGYSWFTAANLGFSNVQQEYALSEGNVLKDGMSYNQQLYQNLLKYDQWNSSANPLAQAERQQAAETFRSQYGGLTSAQIESGEWKKTLRNEQRYAGMLYASENLARGQIGI